MTGVLHGVLRWVARQPGGLELELVCAEHPGPSRGEPGRTVVRLSTCVRDVPAHEVVELLVVGAATVLVRRDGCERRGTASDHLVPAVDVLAAAGVPRLRLVDAGRPAPGAVVARHHGIASVTHLSRRSPHLATREVLDAGRMPVDRRAALGLRAAPARNLPDLLASGPDRLAAAVAALLPAGSEVPAGVPSSTARLAAHG